MATKSINKIELLAPCGSLEAGIAAIQNGADALYLGLKNFSARAFADNFSIDQLSDFVKYAHLRNVKIYVTLNTLYNEYEINNVYEDFKKLYKINIDAYLIQDLGLYYLIKTNYPDAELHCSTQMHVHNLQGVINAKKLGFNRVVIARESNKEFIRDACKQRIEIETFVHGAICVSYSGQCLMSYYTSNRSGNKGMCSQCCRMKYELYDNNHNKISTNTDYLISPKDNFLLEDVPELIKMGVSSLKIEGRMKSDAYVGYVTRIYRKAIDAYYNNEVYHISEQELDNLKILFNREFSDTYYQNDHKDLFNQKLPSHLGLLAGKVIGFNGDYVKVLLNKDLNQFDGIRFYDGTNNSGFIVNMLYDERKNLVNKINKGNIALLKPNCFINKNSNVFITSSKVLDDNIKLSSYNKHILLNLTIKAYSNKKLTIFCNDYNFSYESNIICEKALKQPLNEDNFYNCFKKIHDSAYKLNNLELNTDAVFIRISDLNKIRLDFIDKLNNYRLSLFTNMGIKSNISYKEVKELDGDILEENNKLYINGEPFNINPVVNLDSKYYEENNVVSELGGLLLEGNKVIYSSMNCSNSYCLELYKKLGFSAVIVSNELTSEQASILIDTYNERNNSNLHINLLELGNISLMNILNNPFEKYSKLKNFYLKGNNDEFIVEVKDDYTIIKSSRPLIKEINNKNINKYIIK